MLANGVQDRNSPRIPLYSHGLVRHLLSNALPGCHGSVPPPGGAWWVPTTGLSSASLLHVQVPSGSSFFSVCRSFFMFLYVSLVLHVARRSHLARQPYADARPSLFRGSVFCKPVLFCFCACGALCIVSSGRLYNTYTRSTLALFSLIRVVPPESSVLLR